MIDIIEILVYIIRVVNRMDSIHTGRYERDSYIRYIAISFNVYRYMAVICII